MIVDIKIWINAENVSHDPKNPTEAEIVSIAAVDKEDWNDKTKTVKKYELGIKINGLLQFFTANKTSMKNMMIGFGADELTWPGKKIVLWSVLRDVSGEDKFVIRVEPHP